MINIVNTVEELKRKTVDYIKEIQLSKIPTFIEYPFEKRSSYKFAKEYDSTFTYEDYNLVTEDKYIAIIANGLRFGELQHRTRKEMIFKEPMHDLIIKGDLKPFLLFLNGRFIKWSKITIVHDYRDTYMLVEDPFTNAIDSIEVLYMPISFKYNENGAISNEEEAIFSFDDDGYLNPLGNIKIYCESSNHMITKSGDYLDKYINYTDLNVDTNFKIFKENIILFKKNENNKFLLDRDEIVEISDINLLKINPDKIDDESEYIYKLFYYTAVDNPLNMVSKIPNSNYIKHYIRTLEEADSTDYVLNIMNDFNFTLPIDVPYTQSIPEAVDYITGYDVNIFNSFIEKLNDKVKTINMTGKDIKSCIHNDILTILRKDFYPDFIDAYPMVFINGLLYEKMYTVRLTPPCCRLAMVPDVDVSDDDEVEILLIQMANHGVYPLSQYGTSEGNSIKGWVIPSWMDTSEFLLFTDKPLDQEFIVTNDKHPIYPVEYDVSITASGSKKLVLDEEYYLEDRDFYFISNNIFEYTGKRALYKTFKFVLPYDSLFKYGRNESQYLVFVNGRKVNRSNYRLVLPKATTPFFNTAIYFKFYIEEGDMIDVFYLPFSLDEVESSDTLVKTTLDKSKNIIDIPLPYPSYIIDGHTISILTEDMVELVELVGTNSLTITPSIPENVLIQYNYIRDINELTTYGYINISKASIDYPLDKRLYFIFVNGKKIPLSIIQNISSTCVKITQNINTVENLSIMKYIDPVPCLVDKFKSIGCTWDKIMDDFNPEVLDGLFNSYSDISGNFEPDANIEEIETETIINEIVRDYYMKPNVNDGLPFLYDYDTTYYTKKDDDENIVIPTMDATTGKIVKI